MSLQQRRHHLMNKQAPFLPKCRKEKRPSFDGVLYLKTSAQRCGLQNNFLDCLQAFQ